MLNQILVLIFSKQDKVLQAPATAMFKTANIPCRIIKFCESKSLHNSPSSVTNASDQFSNDDPRVSIVVFTAGTDGNVVQQRIGIFIRLY